LLGSDDPDDFFEQATFRTEKVVGVAGASVADGPCGESKDDKGMRRTHGTSYEVDLTWTDADGDTHYGVMTTCNRPDKGRARDGLGNVARRGLQQVAVGDVQLRPHRRRAVRARRVGMDLADEGRAPPAWDREPAPASPSAQAPSTQTPRAQTSEEEDLSQHCQRAGANCGPRTVTIASRPPPTEIGSTRCSTKLVACAGVRG